MSKPAVVFWLSLISLMAGLAACGPQADDKRTAVPMAAELPYSWTQVLDTAPWPKSYNYQLFTIHDTIWVFHPAGTWFSTDGSHWSSSPLKDVIGNQAFLDYVYFKDALIGLGYYKGNIAKHFFKPAIYQTRNFKTWDTLSPHSNLPARYFYHPFVFDGKIWIIGGEDELGEYADVWNSADAVHWTKQGDRLPFGPRSSSQIVRLRDTLYLLDNEVWRSDDALHWEQVTDEIVKGEKLFGYSALVFDDKIWLLGCNRNGQFTSEVLCSADGKTWLPMKAPWLPRGGIASTVFRNQIFMTGGKYGGTPEHTEFRYDNDLWTLEMKSK